MSMAFPTPALVATIVFASIITVEPVEAASVLTFVSGKGVDAGTCNDPASPCRTFQYAFTRTAAGGEIKALDPANYWSVTITRAVSLTGVPGAGIIRTNAGAAITINAGATDAVSIRDLTIDGFNKAATNGILLSAAGSVEIANCIVRNFSGIGIHLAGVGNHTFSLREVSASGNGNYGIVVQPGGSASSKGLIERTTANKNGTGILVSGLLTTASVKATIVDSSSSNNSTSGIIVDSAVSAFNTDLDLDTVTMHNNGKGLHTMHLAHATLHRSTITGSSVVDIFQQSSATVVTFGNNFIESGGGVLNLLPLQ